MIENIINFYFCEKWEKEMTDLIKRFVTIFVFYRINFFWVADNKFFPKYGEDGEYHQITISFFIFS